MRQNSLFITTITMSKLIIARKNSLTTCIWHVMTPVLVKITNFYMIN